MIRLPLFRMFFAERSVQILARALHQSSFTWKRQQGVESLNEREEKLVNSIANPRARLSSKHQNEHISAIKIPRLLRKTKDKEQIDRYYCIKKLCFEGNFDLAISNVEKWLSNEIITTSTVLILNGLLYSLLEHGKMEDVVRLKNTIDSYGIKGDRSTYTVLIDCFGKMKDLQMVSELLDDMSDLNMDHHYRSYMVATQLALNEENFTKAHEYFSQIQSVYKENHDDFCASFILGLVMNEKSGIMESVFQEFRENQTRLGEQTMLAIERYFHRYNKLQYVASVGSGQHQQAAKVLLTT
jgi:pentatricopeptide repeat protein